MFRRIKKKSGCDKCDCDTDTGHGGDRLGVCRINRIDFRTLLVMGVISRFLNLKKTENFLLTGGECCGILLKLSLRGAAVELKSGLKRMKKVLDKRISV